MEISTKIAPTIAASSSAVKSSISSSLSCAGWLMELGAVVGLGVEFGVVGTLVMGLGAAGTAEFPAGSLVALLVVGFGVLGMLDFTAGGLVVLLAVEAMGLTPSAVLAFGTAAAATDVAALLLPLTGVECATGFLLKLYFIWSGVFSTFVSFDEPDGSDCAALFIFL